MNCFRKQCEYIDGHDVEVCDSCADGSNYVCGVQRYNPCSKNGIHGGMVKAEAGNYVLYKDYEELKDRLK
jgi:hypothetical protein